ncbi:uncharacterized protein CTRU02_215775 [Colletotrichum truncatum]|uniref:Uncharacterized protein n=1 Tax=Colletotrichum truncatum TaxID=5467 RepID=A0ACC3YBN3_COLTU
MSHDQSALAVALGSRESDALNVEEQEALLERLCQLAHSLAKGHPLLPGGHANSNQFSLPPSLLRRFVTRLGDHDEKGSCCVPLHKLQLEYNLSAGTARFKMDELNVNTHFAVSLSNLVHTLACSALHLRADQLLKLGTSSIPLSDKNGQLHPDASWRVFELGPTSTADAPAQIQFPCVALEVALSHPADLEGLVDRYHYLLNETYTSAVIAIKLHYPIQPASDILHNLNQCYDWTPLDDPDDNVVLEPSYFFGEDTLDHGQIENPIDTSTPSDTTNPVVVATPIDTATPEPVIVPFSTIVSKLLLAARYHDALWSTNAR